MPTLFLQSTLMKILITMGFSALPVIELRGGIPLGIGMGLDNWTTFLAAVAGNMLPVPFIILFLRSFLHWAEKRFPRFGALARRLETRAHLKGRLVRKYKVLGLLILVAIPLPGTGAWTGALVSVFLDIRLRSALPIILAGVVIAGVIMMCLTYGVSFFLL